MAFLWTGFPPTNIEGRPIIAMKEGGNAFEVVVLQCTIPDVLANMWENKRQVWRTENIAA